MSELDPAYTAALAETLQLRRRARQSILDYVPALADAGATALGGWYTPAQHHKYILAQLQRVIDGDAKRVMFFLPPGSAKSRYGSVITPSFALGRNPRWSVICASHTLDLARYFGRMTRNLMMSPECVSVWGRGPLVSADNKSQEDWTLVTGGEYRAIGVGGAISGRRADLGIIDDPVAGREEADSASAREKTWRWYLDDFVPRIKPEGRVVLIMQRWHEDDLAGRILARAARTGEQWEVVRIPMEAEENDPLGRKVGERLWPEWFTDAMVVQAKAEPRSWWALYQQQPRPGSGGEFSRDRLRYYRRDAISEAGGCNLYILVDSASGRKGPSAANDYTAAWVIGIGADGKFRVLDMVRDRLDLTARGKMLVRLHKKWHKPGHRVIEVRYEDIGMMADKMYIEELQERENYRFSIVGVGSGSKVSKEDRIRRLLPTLKDQCDWYFPETLYYTGSDGIARDLVQVFIEEELLAFPVGRHDDMLDALARMIEPGMPLLWPVATVINEGYSDGYGNSRHDDRGSAAWV